MYENDSKKLSGDFVHMVFFWLKNPADDPDRRKFLHELSSFLDEVDVIVFKHIGSPAPTDRPVIDSSYTFSLVVTFKDGVDQEIYQEHASHKRFIANAGPLWERVQVYDAIHL